MKRYYETPGGSLDGRDLRNMRLSTNRGLGSRKLHDSVIILIGRKLLAGQGICQVAAALDISRKTVYRYRKALGFKAIRAFRRERWGWLIKPPKR